MDRRHSSSANSQSSSYSNGSNRLEDIIGDRAITVAEVDLLVEELKNKFNEFKEPSIRINSLLQQVQDDVEELGKKRRQLEIRDYLSSTASVQNVNNQDFQQHVSNIISTVSLPPIPVYHREQIIRKQTIDNKKFPEIQNTIAPVSVFGDDRKNKIISI